MKNHCLKLIVSVCCSLFCGGAYACPGTPAPVHLLGAGVYSREVLAVVDVAPHADSDVIDIDARRQTKFIVDGNRNYFYAEVFEGSTESISFYDPCLTTGEGVRIGDSLSRVRSVYPDAKFKYSGEISHLMLANDGKVELEFDENKVVFIRIYQ